MRRLHIIIFILYLVSPYDRPFDAFHLHFGECLSLYVCVYVLPIEAPDSRIYHKCAHIVAKPNAYKFFSFFVRHRTPLFFVVPFYYVFILVKIDDTRLFYRRYETTLSLIAMTMALNITYIYAILFAVFFFIAIKC